jgi:hypothetical protein
MKRALWAKRPSPAMLVALVALFVALGSGAYAATTLPKNSVTSTQIVKGGVKGPDIAADAIVSSKIKDGQVRSRDIIDKGVTRADLAISERLIWAAVRSDGTILRTSGEVTKVDHIAGTGRYTLTLTGDVSKCAWVASTSSDETTAQGYAEGQRNGTATNQLTVITSRPQGGVSVAVDRDFHIIVACSAPAATPAPAPAQ